MNIVSIALTWNLFRNIIVLIDSKKQEIRKVGFRRVFDERVRVLVPQ